MKERVNTNSLHLRTQAPKYENPVPKTHPVCTAGNNCNSIRSYAQVD